MTAADKVSETGAWIFDYMTSVKREHWGMDIEHWDWVPGVGLISILDYGVYAEDQRAVDYAVEWAKRNEGLSDQARVINSMAPYALYPVLYRLSGNTEYLSKAREIARWMLESAPRTREGAFEHTVTEDAAFPEQVWADTVYMAVLFLSRLARAADDRGAAEAALEQTLLHFRLLQDDSTGLLFHGWDCARRNYLSGARWARANAWVMLAVPEIVRNIRGLAGIPEELLIRYRELAAELRKVQAEDGLWHTVLDRSDFYKESSASAGIACGMVKAVRTGLLDEACLQNARLALEGLLPLVTAEGEVRGVSGGTPVLASIAAYNEVPRYPTLYGQGLVLQLLAEFRLLEREA